jgi:phenylalanyl-tRNA synthetase beta chain
MEKLLGKSLPHDAEGLNEIMGYVKGDIETVQNDIVTIEVKDSNRPDIWSTEGIARALRGYLGIRTRNNVRVTGKSRLNVVIDKRLRQIRPFISTAIVKGLSPTEDILKGWIDLQEKLDRTYGRKRKKASIGFYQADMVESPLSYTVSDPDKARFAPLGTNEKLSLREIVTTHPKGIEFGETISKFDKYPILIDGSGKVLSLPPIINSNDLGRITTDTKNILVEVTGTHAETVHNTLKVVVTALAERGGKIYSCTETYPYGTKRKVESPDLSPTTSKLSLAYINKLVGTTLNLKEAVRLVERAGYSVTAASSETINVDIPSYRIDIMHLVDIVEDVAIALNVNKLEPEWPRIWTVGGLTEATRKTELVEEVMVGLGFQQILTYALTSPRVINDKMNTKSALVDILNPKLTTHTALRSWLLPSLLEFLSHNTHVDYPQKIFEAGRCIRHLSNSSISETSKLAAISIHASAGFTEMRSLLDALIENVDADFQITETQHPSFLPGRCGSIKSDGKEQGIIGEVSPLVLRAWGLGLPAAAFELELDSLFSEPRAGKLKINE